MKLLIVDNEEMLVDILRLGFDAKGIETIAAYDGLEALDIVTNDVNHEIVAILTDIAMPKMNGWDLVKEVKRLRPDISLMILSAETEAWDIGLAMVAEKSISAAFNKSTLCSISFAETVISVVRGLNV